MRIVEEGKVNGRNKVAESQQIIYTNKRTDGETSTTKIKPLPESIESVHTYKEFNPALNFLIQPGGDLSQEFTLDNYQRLK